MSYGGKANMTLLGLEGVGLELSTRVNIMLSFGVIQIIGGGIGCSKAYLLNLVGMY